MFKYKFKTSSHQSNDFGKLTGNHPFVFGQLLLSLNDKSKEIDSKKIEEIIP
jgi:hypothetical protein